MDRGLELSSCIYLQIKSLNPAEPSIIILILSIQQKPHIFSNILQFRYSKTERILNKKVLFHTDTRKGIRGKHLVRARISLSYNCI